jgi:hypothetical protein
MVGRVVVIFLSLVLLLGSPALGLAPEHTPPPPSSGHVGITEPTESEAPCAVRSPAAQDRLESEALLTGPVVLDNIQIETADLRLFEMFFEEVLKAPLIERLDHPGRDSIRGYCYRGIRVIVRRDHANPRLTGWVQLNFAVSAVDVIQRELETALVDSRLASLSQVERERVVRIRFKPDVRRGKRKAIRLEVLGPEGFVIGFNQYKS